MSTLISQPRSLANDLKFGLANEVTITQLLESTFNEQFRNTKEIYNTPYHPYDFEGNKGTCIEVKSRRNRYAQYPTTIVPVSKVVKKSDDPNHKYLFVFHFIDGTYYIPYDEDKFAKYETRMITTYRAGIVDKPKPHFCIDIKDLIKI